MCETRVIVCGRYDVLSIESHHILHTNRIVVVDSNVVRTILYIHDVALALRTLADIRTGHIVIVEEL